MFENIGKFFKKIVKAEQKENTSKDTAKERLHLVLMQDRANVSADFLELMKQEIIDVIKKYIVVDEGAIDVRLTNQANDDGTNGAPALYANIPILNIKTETIDGEQIEEVIEEKIVEEITKEIENEKTIEQEQTSEEIIEEKEEKSNEVKVENIEKKENKKEKKKDSQKEKNTNLEQEKKDK